MAKLLVILVLVAIIWWWWKQSRFRAALKAATKPQSKRLSMPEKEAREVLGVDAEADSEAIRAAHRRLIAAVHPDRGGSAELTQRINAARDILLRHPRD